MPDIQHSVQIAARPEIVYPLTATARGFSLWWATDITEGDGTVELGFFDRSTIYRLRLRVDRPPTEAQWSCDTGDEWNGTQLLFRLDVTSSGTVLRFTQSGWRSESDYFVSCNTTWGALMYRLKSVAQGNHPGPLFLATEMAY
jgi:hypothetical protein